MGDVGESAPINAERTPSGGCEVGGRCVWLLMDNRLSDVSILLLDSKWDRALAGLFQPSPPLLTGGQSRQPRLRAWEPGRTVHLDWGAFTCREDCRAEVERLIFGCGPVEEGSGRNLFYKSRRSNGFVDVYFGAFSDKCQNAGTAHVSIKGQALEQYREKGLTDLELIRTIEGLPGFLKWTRLDVAFNDYTGAVDLAVMEAHLRGREWAGSAHEWNVQTSNKRGWEGRTVYVGGRASEAFFRGYNKKAQMLSKIREKDRMFAFNCAVKHWNRLEIELKGDRARAFAAALQTGARMQDLFSTELTRIVDFRVGTGVVKRRWHRPRWWRKVLNGCRRAVLQIVRRVKTFEGWVSWMDAVVRVQNQKVLAHLGGDTEAMIGWIIGGRSSPSFA